MTSIRKFAYASLLALTTLNILPSWASAQEPAHGKFTLTHDVHWGNAYVPAGEYQFAFNAGDLPGVLMLNKINGPRAGFMLMVRDTDNAAPSDVNRLLLQSTAGGSYVSAMQLPEFGITLNFKVPSHTAERQIARAVSAATGPAQ
jgi:hypothetical protein